MFTCFCVQIFGAFLSYSLAKEDKILHNSRGMVNIPITRVITGCLLLFVWELGYHLPSFVCTHLFSVFQFGQLS